MFQTEFCMWQRYPWRKSTIFLAAHVNFTNIQERRCRCCTRGFCSRIGRKHERCQELTRSQQSLGPRLQSHIRRLCAVLLLFPSIMQSAERRDLWSDVRWDFDFAAILGQNTSELGSVDFRWCALSIFLCMWIEVDFIG